MVGGVVSSTVLTLVVIPAIDSLWRERQLGAAGATAADARGGSAEPLAAGAD